MKTVRTPLVLTLAASGCISAGFGPMPSDESFATAIVVEYWVQCRDCRVEYWTPEGVGSVDSVGGGFREVFSFAEPPGQELISLTALPPDSDYVTNATISVNGRVVAQGGRNVEPTNSGEPVRLSAWVGRRP